MAKGIILTDEEAYVLEKLVRNRISGLMRAPGDKERININERLMWVSIHQRLVMYCRSKDIDFDQDLDR
jgi:hypothetical protein